jgi:hypothetical protein
MFGVGNCSGREFDKFALVGLTPIPAEPVAPRWVDEVTSPQKWVSVVLPMANEVRRVSLLTTSRGCMVAAQQPNVIRRVNNESTMGVRAEPAHLEPLHRGGNRAKYSTRAARPYLALVAKAKALQIPLGASYVVGDHDYSEATVKTEAQLKKEARGRAARALQKTKKKLGLGPMGPLRGATRSPLATRAWERDPKPAPTSDRIPGPASAKDLLHAQVLDGGRGGTPGALQGESRGAGRSCRPRSLPRHGHRGLRRLS